MKTLQQLITEATAEEERAAQRFEQHWRNAVRAHNDMRKARKRRDRLTKRWELESGFNGLDQVKEAATIASRSTPWPKGPEALDG